MTLKAMRTFIFSILCAVLFVFTADSALAQCTTKLAELPAAPELFGLRLDMTRDEIKVWVPQTVFGKKDDFGVIKTTINPFFDPKIDQAKFTGVRSVSLEILDDKLTSVWIGFDSTFRVQPIEDFMKLVSQSLKVSGQWKPARLRGFQLQCADFQLAVSTIANGPSLRITENAAEETIAERRAAKEEADSAAQAAQTTDTDDEELLGDRQSKTFYSTGCKPAKDISEQYRVLFKNSEEAKKAGFKLAPNCH